MPKIDRNAVRFIAGLYVGAIAGHWLISPMRHPHAPYVQTLLVSTQLVTGIAVAVWAYRSSKRGTVTA